MRPPGDSQNEPIAKHTPKPWRVERNTDGKPMGVSSPANMRHDLDLLCSLPYADRQWSPEEVEANGRLIAAAPDLLASLIAMTEIISRPNQAAARAAIAKATEVTP